jgi:hypothetical protein
VLTLRGGEIEEITAFLTPDDFRHLACPIRSQPEVANLEKDAMERSVPVTRPRNHGGAAARDPRRHPHRDESLGRPIGQRNALAACWAAHLVSQCEALRGDQADRGWPWSVSFR